MFEEKLDCMTITLSKLSRSSQPLFGKVRLKLGCQWLTQLYVYSKLLFKIKTPFSGIYESTLFPVNDNTRGKDTEEWDTSSCNGFISRRFGPTEEVLIRTKPKLIHPQPPANALDATSWGTDIQGSTCTSSTMILSQGGGTWSISARSSSGSSFLRRLHHTPTTS